MKTTPSNDLGDFFEKNKQMNEYLLITELMPERNPFQKWVGDTNGENHEQLLSALAM